MSFRDFDYERNGVADQCNSERKLREMIKKKEEQAKELKESQKGLKIKHTFKKTTITERPGDLSPMRLRNRS
jgi:hypothetical protein